MPRCCKGARTSILLAEAIIALVAGRQGALADESGASFWLLGTYATQAAVPSDPGLSIDMTYYSAGASAGRAASFARGGRIEVGLDTASNYILLTPTYTFEPKVLGGQFAFGVTALWGNYASTVSANLVGPSGRSLSGALGDSMTAFGDLFPTATLKWNSGVNNFMTYLTANVPIGAYDVNRQATVGMGRWAIDGGLGYTYFHEAKGLEFSAVAGLTYNFMNPYTAYQSGIDLHVEISASYYLTERLLAGAAGYFYQQITADSGPGATLGPFISRVAGVGPQLGYDFALGRRQASLSARGYYEFAGQNRPQGWTAWLTFVVSLGVPGQKAGRALNTQQRRRPIAYLNRYLEPAESLAEILFGLIMVLTCTLGASVIAGIDRDSLRTLFIAALGCNVAWGIIDAALYVMGAVFVRTRNARIMEAVRSANGDAAALAVVRASARAALRCLWPGRGSRAVLSWPAAHDRP